MDRRIFLQGSLNSALLSYSLPFAQKTTMIDSHVHVWKRDRHFPFAKEAKAPDFDIAAEDLLRLMKENGVARTVLIQVIHYRWDNRYLLDVLHRYPGKFHGVCRVDPEDPAAPDHLSMLTASGCHGVRLSPDATPKSDWIRGALMAPLWQRCAQLKVPMTLLLPASRLPDSAVWIEKNPDLDVVIDHMADVSAGDAKQLQLLLAMARYPRVYLKISQYGLFPINRFPTRTLRNRFSDYGTVSERTA